MGKVCSAVLVYVIGLVVASVAPAQSLEEDVTPLVKSSCLLCHGDLTVTPPNLQSLGFDLADPEMLRAWERVEDGEMPPLGAPRPDRAIEMEIVRSFGDLLTQLSERGDANGSLLDQTPVLFGSNLGNASSHQAKNLPILFAGGGYRHGQHIAHDAEHNTPLCNLFVTMLQSMGMETDSFGQSTGALTWS